jgi:hypothetical protein
MCPHSVRQSSSDLYQVFLWLCMDQVGVRIRPRARQVHRSLRCFTPANALPGLQITRWASQARVFDRRTRTFSVQVPKLLSQLDGENVPLVGQSGISQLCSAEAAWRTLGQAEYCGFRHGLVMFDARTRIARGIASSRCVRCALGALASFARMRVGTRCRRRRAWPVAQAISCALVIGTLS